MTKKYHKQPAKITSAFLGFEDHDIFTVILHVDYGHVAQGVGTYCLGVKSDYDRPMRPTKAGCDFIMSVLEACGVRSWDQLKGCRIQVLFEEEFVLNARPVGIEGFEFDGGKQFLFADFGRRADYEKAVEKHLAAGTWDDERVLDSRLWPFGWSHDK